MINCCAVTGVTLPPPTFNGNCVVDPLKLEDISSISRMLDILVVLIPTLIHTVPFHL